jgi:hypothetical protein
MAYSIIFFKKSVTRETFETLLLLVQSFNKRFNFHCCNTHSSLQVFSKMQPYFSCDILHEADAHCDKKVSKLKLL